MLILDLYRASLGVSLGGECRFYPSCSTYARQAILKYGALTGSAKAMWRLVRCNPFNPGGVDEP
ncbi:membrane protein insertion efficiency factor YidD [bacterium]|nr:membrane protein insertion efficiency factor YidD [bacterium]MBU1651973.1 membrane protein insertion efficiency factor YidD [bacterium]